MNAAALAALLRDTGAACMPAPVLDTLAAAHGAVCAGASPECKTVETTCTHCSAPVCGAHAAPCDACLARHCIVCHRLCVVQFYTPADCRACPACRKERARADLPACARADLPACKLAHPWCRSVCRAHTLRCFVCSAIVCHYHDFVGPCDNTFLCKEHAPTCPECKGSMDCAPGVVDNRILSHDRTRCCVRCFKQVAPVLDGETERTMRVLIAFGLGSEE